jgi:hypothetical protein
LNKRLNPKHPNTDSTKQPATFPNFAQNLFFMKKLMLFSLLALLFTLVASDDLYAQKKGKKKKSSKNDEYFDESGFINKLWYGGGINLPNFFGGGEYNIFSIGVSPMAGYKIIGDRLSVGPRVSVDYLHVKGFAVDQSCNNIIGNSNGQARTFKVNTTTWSVGAFSRVKIIPAVFAHFEYENQHANQIPTCAGFLVYDQTEDDIFTVEEVRDNLYIGAGYHNGGGLWGYEILLLYNVNQPDNTIDLPFSFRFGLTYKF